MAFSKFEHVKISGISVVIPEREIDIYDEAHYYNNDIKKIDRMRKIVGFHKRRVVEDGVTASDLGIQAAENLFSGMYQEKSAIEKSSYLEESSLEKSAIEKSAIDALIYVCQRPDFQSPATSFYIHKKLNLSSDCVVFDINQGCPGWVYGLWFASQMIESKTCKKVLLIAADNPSLGINPAHRTIAPLFGDAGTATLLEYSEEKSSAFYSIETHSGDYEAIIHPAGQNRCLFKHNYQEKDAELLFNLSKNPVTTPFGFTANIFDLYIDGAAVFDFTISVVPKNIRALMEYANKKHNDISALCLHQANKQIIETVCEESGFALEKTSSFVFENYGNNTMCSIPATIASVYHTEASTQKHTFLCSAFGNGLACASVILELDNIYSSGIRIFQKPHDFITREEYITYWENKLKGE